MEGQVPKVGMKVTVCLWSDRNVHTVVWVSRTQKRMEIQRDKVTALHSKEDLGWVPGGFSAVATSQEKQKWACTPDPDGTIEKFSLRVDGKWHKVGEPINSPVALIGVESEFYDFNF